jgi:hypothetical protein
VTTLRAAEKFDKSHLSSPSVAPLIDAAQVFYVEGYFLTHGVESVLEIAKKASSSGKVIIKLIQAFLLYSHRQLIGLRFELFRSVHCYVLWGPAPAGSPLL